MAGAMRPIRLTLALLLGLALFAPTAKAQGVERIGSFRNWAAYTTSENGKLVCFAASVPVKSDGDYKRRGKVFSVVTLRPTENRDPEVSFIAGYAYKDESQVDVDIDGKKFVLFTQGDAAWLPNDPKLDSTMIGTMAAGATMLVQGTSSRGTATVDNYSLLGFTAALDAAKNACK
jgi:hypothetical protein